MPWDSLELSKLAIQAATPVVAIGIAYRINRAIEQFKHTQWRNQKLIERRIAAYDTISPELNDIICYYAYIGRWKEFSPLDILSKKRSVDKSIYLSAPFFSEDILEPYDRIMDLCFSMFSGNGQDARLRTKAQNRKPFFNGAWDSTWDTRFTDEKLAPATYFDAYHKLISIFSNEIGLESVNK
ncbi:hypothetical protein [Magnetospirillum gryphiswaldense]|uniref:Uncharacterized protein n=1 Tax=Magnetospirillum gryphiswaldense TaxID=55518 RepID=A4TZP5_9PROT|nr:hypothetical protein [Magnetospirillum gryphiswaldense]AVM75048.1 hypothetical protein MSR1_25670 [Magnetospirillum gryphiswaldense MSR-1]AVM78951.1 hypothetical protein MSR1L_25670 [Magnetospirillum gryphiswaldense]CAM76102.1 conserved hypothetical protein [Magnetospirillum gryphiswaldense MSR-1]